MPPLWKIKRELVRVRRQVLPPTWKVKRELARIGWQLESRVFRHIKIPVLTVFYDLCMQGKVRKTAGRIKLADRVAVYVIFPSNRLLASHLLALRHLTEEGYSPVLVSNLPLSDQEREQVTPYCSVILERPNWGYDFGGYREGILWLRKMRHKPEFLALLNDSCWFPTSMGTSWFSQAERLGLDFVGAVFHEGMDAENVPDLKNEPWRIDRTLPKFHYGSFLLLIRSTVLRSAVFNKFWANYSLTNDKSTVIKRGEIGLTRKLVSSGFSHGAVYDTTFLDKTLQAMDREKLVALTKDLLLPGYPGLQDEQKSLVSDPTTSREDLIAFILKSVASQGPAYALAVHCGRSHEFKFLKKLPLLVSQNAAIDQMAYVRTLTGPSAEIIQSEAERIFKQRWPALQETGRAA